MAKIGDLIRSLREEKGVTAKDLILYLIGQITTDGGTGYVLEYTGRAIAALSIEGTPDVQWSSSLVAIMAYNGPIASGFCFWAYLTVSSNLPAMNTAIGSLGIPVIGVISSAFILGESLNLSVVSGLVLILLGILAVSLNDLRRSEPSNPLK